MRINTNYLKAAVFAAFTALAFACNSPEVDPTPTPTPKPDDGGDKTPEVKIECQQVYFAPDNTTFLLAEDGTNSITVKVMRNKADAAITVPINANKKEGLTVPSSVEFAASSKEASFDITWDADAPAPSIFEAELELTGDHVDSFLQGVETIYAVQVVKPEVIRAKAFLQNASYTTKSQYGVWEQQVLRISDTHYILKNFLKSDFDVTVKGVLYDEKNDLWHLSVDSPVGYNDYDDEYGDYTWYFTDENDEWLKFYPFGEDAWFHISALSILNYGDEPDGSSYACYAYPESKIINIACTENWYSDSKAYSYYDNIRIVWSDQEFEENLPDYVEPEEHETISVVGYLASNPDTKYTWEGYWDGYNFTVVGGTTGMTYYADMSFNLDADFNLSGITNDYTAFYEDAEYGNYWYLQDYFNILGDYYYGYIYQSGSYYDYDANAFYLSIDVNVDVNADSGWVTDTLVIMPQE